MIIQKSIPNVGFVNIELPLEIGDSFKIGNNEYIINKFALLNDCIFAVNPNIWINIEDLEFVKTIGNHKLFKVVNKEVNYE